jgi:hypothetical protein
VASTAAFGPAFTVAAVLSVDPGCTVVHRAGDGTRSRRRRASRPATSVDARRSLGRSASRRPLAHVAPAAEHLEPARVSARPDVIDDQIGCCMRRPQPAGAPIAVLSAVAANHTGGEAGPGRRARGRGMRRAGMGARRDTPRAPRHHTEAAYLPHVLPASASRVGLVGPVREHVAMLVMILEVGFARTVNCIGQVEPVNGARHGDHFGRAGVPGCRGPGRAGHGCVTGLRT